MSGWRSLSDLGRRVPVLGGQGRRRSARIRGRALPVLALLGITLSVGWWEPAPVAATTLPPAPGAAAEPRVSGAPGPGNWEGLKSPETAGDFLAAGSGAPAGPAQFTYTRLDPLPDVGEGGGESGEWDFYTTADAAGTIQIPWRYTGFHGFAGVTVGLEAWVISELSSDTSDILVATGPQSCCTEPSAGFDYEGIAEFEVQPGDTYGFTLTGSNGDTNDTLRGELVLGTALPTDCTDAGDLYGASTDGRYLILPTEGQRFSVHCDFFTEGVADYLELHVERIGPAYNFSSYAAGGASPGTTVTTHFEKLRFDPATLTVDINDRTFASSSGSLTHTDGELGAQQVDSMPYATAMACNNGVSNGTANVDLFGTPFVVADEWFPVGTASGSYGGTTISSGGKVVDVQGNGFCGWRQPDPSIDPLFVWDDNGPRFDLQLAYGELVSAPFSDPVVFASVARSGTTADIYARVEGAANTPLTVAISTATSCTGGSLSAPSLVATVSATSDAEGYVVIPGVAGIPSGRFVSIQVTAPTATGSSTCVRTTADNDYWPKALNLASTTTAQDVVEIEGRSRWYRIPIVPDQRVTVTLSNLPADYDLAVFKDIAREFESQLVPQTADDLAQLSAEFAPSVFSPSVFSPSVFSPSVFSPDAYAPSVFSPSVFSPSVFSPSVFSPSVFSPSVFSPSVFSPSVFSPSVFSPSVFSPSVFSPSVFSPSVFSPDEIEQAFSSAQTRSLVGVSATPGTGSETVVVNTWNNTGFFYVRVSGRGGAFDQDDLFTLSVNKSTSTCSGVTNTTISDRGVASGAGQYATVILTDSSKLALGSATDSNSLRSKLEAFRTRPEVDGVLIDLATLPSTDRTRTFRTQVQQNQGCPFAVNLLAEEIKSIVDSYRAPSGPETLRYVTIIGDDTVIPFFRYPDQSRLGQESGYFPPVNSTTISEASLRRDYTLSQDAYGAGVSVDIRTNVFPVPGLAVGRLVETPAEIAGMLDAYTATNGEIQPESSLVTGYDFLTDAADAVSDELFEGTHQPVNELITAADVSPLRLEQPGDTSPRQYSWTAADLREELLTDRHDLIYLAGHFSANSALAADYRSSVITTELAASSVNLTNSIVFSGGCHSGYNLVDSEALAGVALPLDWAQAFAQKKAILIAGTGYQYGDTEFLEYSERLYRDFARQLRAGPVGTAVSVGEALAHAKRSYLATTPDIRGIHEKAILEATLFGLPMLGVEMEFGRGAVPGFSGAINPAAVGGTLAGFGLATSDLGVATPLTTPTPLALDVIESGGVTGTISAQWLVGPDGVVTNPAEPAIPKHVKNVTSTNASQVLRGVGWRGGTYTDTPNILPLTGAPTTELRGVHAPFVSPVFYPMKLWTPNYFGALDGTGGTNLIVTPVQHKSDAANPGKTVRRVFSNLDLRLFYSSNLGQVALSDAPTIVKVESELDGGNLVFRAQVVGDPKAAMHQVWITWTNGNGTWQPLDLTQSPEDSRLWTGVLANPVGNIQYVAQAVNGVGLVAFDDNLGRYYSAAGAAPVVATSMSLISPATTGQHGDTIAVTAELKAGSTPLVGKPVTISLGGGSGTQGVTNSVGRVTLNVPVSGQPGSTQLVASFGGDQGHLASSASSPFTITAGDAVLTLSVPAQTLIGGSATATATLTGAGAPLSDTSVAFIVTAPNGTKTLREVKTDFAGRASIVLPTAVVGPYIVEARFGSIVTVGTSTIDLRSPIYGPASDSETHLVIWPFTGFFSPVDNPGTTNVLNTVKAGNTVPFRFALGGDRGLQVIAAGYPKAVKFSCTSGTPEDAIEETSTANNGLAYNASTGEYQYNWKTPKNYAGSCYRFELKLIDGTTHSANFKFK